MKLEKIQRSYDDFTMRASQIARTLGLGGVAAVWLIGGGIDTEIGKLRLSPWLIGVLFLFVVALTLDLLHAAVGAASWGICSWVVERRLRARGDLTADAKVPRLINWAPNLLFWSKLLVLGIAYFGLAIEVARRI